MAYRGSQLTVGNAVTTISAALPSGTVASDVLIAQVFGPLTAAQTIDTPAGWTVLRANQAHAGGVSWEVVYLWALGNVANLTFTHQGTNANSFAVNIHAFSGRNTSSPITASAINTPSDSGGTGNVVSPTVTAVLGDDLLVMHDAAAAGNFGSVSPAGTTNIFAGVQGASSSAAAYLNAVTAGVTTAYTRTTNAFVRCSSVVIALAGFTGPTVSTVTTPGTTEAGNMVFTASLSGATSGTTNYAFTLGGTATAGVDYTSPLTSAMCSNGVTVVGSDFVVPTAVSGWTVTIPTTSDTIDEADETIILTIGGTSGTGTITDDDAAPIITVSDAPSVTAGSPAVFTITLDRAKSTSITVDAVCVDGTLVGGVGYTSNLALATYSNGVTFGAGALTIPAGVTSFTVSIATA